MKFSRLLTTVVLAVSGLFATLGTASAYEAAATVSLNVRSGPSTGYRVVGVLRPNQVVDVLRCNSTNTWCEIQDPTVRGWASARYLRPVGNSGGGNPTPPPSNDNEPNVGISINTPNFSFSIGTGTPPSQRPTGEVCFYEGYDYRGRSFCVEYGDSSRRLDNFWTDRIRSATVQGNISATVCTAANFNGRCAVISRSIRNLGVLSDDISSFYVGDR